MTTQIIPSDQSGFSVLGALAGIALLGAAFVVATPYFAQARSQLDTRWASDDVVEVLAEARKLAQRRGRLVRVEVDERNRTVWVEGGSWRKLPAGLTLSGPPPGPDGRAFVDFHPDGSSDGGQMVVAMPGRAVSLVVERGTGRVRRIEAGRP